MKRKIARQFNSSNHRFERYIDLDASIDAACQCRMHTLELDSFDILCETGNAPPTFFFVCLEFAKKMWLANGRTTAHNRVPRSPYSTSDVIPCNFKHHLSVNPELFFRSEIFFYPATFFFSSRFRDYISSIASSPRLYLSLFLIWLTGL